MTNYDIFRNYSSYVDGRKYSSTNNVKTVTLLKKKQDKKYTFSRRCLVYLKEFKQKQFHKIQLKPKGW